MTRPFAQIDVFTDEPYRGNPVAVVLDGDGLSDEEMQRFANWTNLSETTFLLPPGDAGADYAVRIFTPTEELPFAGHPTLGTCHAWLERRGGPAPDTVTQECKAGLVPIRRTPDGLAFAAPPLVRSGAVDDDTVAKITGILGITREEIVDTEWADNGPGWVGVLLDDPQRLLELRPGALEGLFIGAAAPHAPDDWEVRCWFGQDALTVEDPVTGSFNAALGQWLLRTGRATAPYVARQGTALDRRGRAHISQDGDGAVWVGGGTVTCVSGDVEL